MLQGGLADICNQNASNSGGVQDRPFGPGKVGVTYTDNSCTENVTCTLCPHNQTATPLDARFNESGESYCIFTNLPQNVHYTVKIACNGMEIAQKKLEYYFNSEPVRNSPNVSTWSRSASIMMEAFCFAMKVDIGYMMVNIRGDNMDTSCVVFPTCDKCNNSLCPEPPLSCRRQPRIDFEKCDEQTSYINITLPLDNLRPSTDYTFDLYYIYCDLNTNIISNSTMMATTGAGDPVNVTNINATPIGPRNINVTWTLPSPDPANYTLYITDPRAGEAETGCDVDTTWPIVIPWNVTTYKENSIQGPHDIPVPYPFWQYQVAVVMSTETGNSTPQWVTVRTLPESPGAVSHLNVTRRETVEGDIKCGNAAWESYNDVCVMWEEVCPRERGDDITTYEYSLSNGGTPETKNVNCKPGDNQEKPGKSQDMTRTTCSFLLPVETGSNYKLCMTAIGQTNKGLTNCTSFQVPPMKPNITNKQQHQAREIPTQKHQTKFTLSLTSYCFMTSDIFGKVVNNGFVISKKTWTNDVNLYNLPTWYNRSMGYYQIRPSFLKNHPTSCGSKRDFTVGNENCDLPVVKPYCNGPLDPGTTYSVTAFVCTKDGCDTVPVAKDITTQEEPGVSPYTVVAICLGLLCIPLLGFLFYLLFWRDRGKRGSLDVQHVMRVVSRPIPLSKLEQEVTKKEAHDWLLLREEYEDIQHCSKKSSCSNSFLECNRGKNRFADISAYDHSRVSLSVEDAIEGSDYINANFIPGLTASDEFIATQGPLPATRKDMWRMVWERQVPMIIMLTQIVERGRVMCDLYWSSTPGDVKEYGQVIVRTLSVSTTDDYTITTFSLRHDQVPDEERELLHLHYLKWPDMTADVSLDSMIHFLYVVRHMLPENSPGPIVVHCRLDILKFVLRMRENRCRMVQTDNQYIFIHQCARHLMAMRRKRESGEDVELAVHVAPFNSSASLTRNDEKPGKRASDENGSASEGADADTVEADMNDEDVAEDDKLINVPDNEEKSVEDMPLAASSTEQLCSEGSCRPQTLAASDAKHFRQSLPVVPPKHARTCVDV
ncbi:hypothetical protein C0Q70_11885 [Pomacea canaliculata]|uniref:Tyrosine-protein phosphatase domain-containing protein n=1 Tax=Pomacea canaliculata TaxID=400727 RepID=A0A2T7P789_POMCA|nr:hypothetical protein C0Q70_11885 [Pomacea canaliculata]